MSYGQINYPQNLGSGPSVDTIADVGCFLVAFCNLLERFGDPIDPPALNNFFTSHGIYMVDPVTKNRDNLGYGSISAFNGKFVATGIGGAGWPPTNNAIVKFNYKSKRTGKQITHFSLVADRDAGTILDSWDGRVKASPYGRPVSWATYIENEPQVVAPPPSPNAAAFSVENIPHKQVQITKNTSLWDLNQRSWPGMVNNPAGSAENGKLVETSRIAKHILGGKYYIPDGESYLGYNVVDCLDYTAPAPAPEAVPTPPPAPPVRPGGNPDNRYTVIRVIPGYMTGTQAGNHTNQANEVAPGEYFVYNVHPNNPNLINVTSKLGVPGSWINAADNVETPPPPPPAPEPVPEPTPVPEPVVEAPVPSWKDSFVPFSGPVQYIANKDISVQDLSGQGIDLPLQRYDPGSGTNIGVVSAFGTVTKGSIDYYRLKTGNDPEFKLWYAVPKLDPITGTPNLLLRPAPGQPVGKATIVRDTIQLAKTHVSEADFGKYLDDMIPKFLKKQKNKNK